MYPSNQIVPFDVASMTTLPPIAIEYPRHLRAGGGYLWVGTGQLEGALARVVPETGVIALRSLPATSGASGVDSLAYGGE